MQDYVSSQMSRVGEHTWYYGIKRDRIHLNRFACWIRVNMWANQQHLLMHKRMRWQAWITSNVMQCNPIISCLIWAKMWSIYCLNVDPGQWSKQQCKYQDIRYHFGTFWSFGKGFDMCQNILVKVSCYKLKYILGFIQKWLS